MKFVNMKYKILENIVVMISLIILFFTGLHVVVNLNSSVANNIVHEKEINLSESINNIKLENKDLKLVYESNNVKDFYILVYLETLSSFPFHSNVWCHPCLDITQFFFKFFYQLMPLRSGQ